MSTNFASSIFARRSSRHFSAAIRALFPLLLLALSAFLLSGAPQLGGSALAGCSQSGSVVTCTGSLPDPISYNSGVSTLNVNNLQTGTTSIRLTGTGSAASNGVTTFTCSTSDGCTIASDSSSCVVKTDKDGNALGQCLDVKAPGGTGSSGPTIAVDVSAPTSGPITIGSGRTGVAVTGISFGSNGGNGSNAYVFGDGGDGGNGANGGAATVSFVGQIPYSAGGGLLVESKGGNGGDGGDFKGIGGKAGSGGKGGAGGNAIANFNGGSITTTGDGNNGITSISQGGNGGSAGHGGGLVYVGGSGNSAGQAGSAEVNTAAGTSILTYGNFANGIQALSVGGGGGSGSGGFGLFYSGGGDGSTGGAGGSVNVKANGSIQTYGNYSNGILAQSIGGGGGNAGSVAGAVALGGSGAGGGGGGSVSVQNTGSITTSGIGANAIEAQSIGGGGGNGANSGGLFSMGGNGSGTTTGGTVSVTNDGTLVTGGVQAAGIVAQSIGGGGGNGGTSGGLFAFGGSGGSGANGGKVTVTNGGSITTTATGTAGSPGILAQSIGGGGGNGGGSVSASPGVAVAFGGKGGMAGSGDSVTVLADSNSYAIQTAGDNSSAIIAQSIGGGGGNGGFAVAASANPLFSVALGTGGSGGAGGSGGTVSVTTNGSLTTTGANSDGILAQSLGGGGGNGGFAIAASLSETALSVGIGGSGGAGGGASGVTVDGHGDVSTGGLNSIGIAAQSIGGGGGNGGFAGSGTVAIASVSVGVGGSGGSGGAAGSATVTNSGGVHTEGANATGIAAQSIGGGGGNGGFAGTAAVTLGGGANVGVGGKGGTGGTAGAAWAQQSGSLWTEGNNSTAILAQSIGGGGGNGGFSAGGSVGAAGAISVTVGGSGGAGQNAGSATVVVDGNGQYVSDFGYGSSWNTVTRGANSAGVVAQSIGGGGGNGGFSAGAALSGGYSVGVAIGGSGAGGGDAAAALVHNGYTYDSGTQTYAAGSNNILTTGDLSAGIIAQSIGGGGGNGGFAGALGGSIGPGAAGAFTLGGAGGAGGLGKSAEVDNIGNVHTVGNFSDGVIVQSIGGSGGNGGMSIAVSATTSSFGGAVAIGGTGGAGNNSDWVKLTSTGDIVTEGVMSNGIFAQSVGGGGGNGGVAGSGAISFGTSASVSVGGTGAGGGGSEWVNVSSNGSIRTSGDGSSAIVAQSIGGGGGNGGGSIGVALGGAGGLGVAVGGSAGAGGSAKDVTVLSAGDLTTGYGQQAARGTSNAFGILAQSIGGGGGNGGYAGSVSLGGVVAGSVSVGGQGGAGGSAGQVGVTSTGSISTVFDNSAAIMAQSIGGGGGNGGFSFAVSASGAIEDVGGSAAIAVGGFGGQAGQAESTTVTSTGNIHTQGVNSAGIVAQSIGGGGGNGGWSLGGTASVGVVGLGVSVGGFGAGGGDGKAVTVDSYGAAGKTLQAAGTATLETDGALSDGILAQSLGGGGGNGGWSVAAGGAIGGGGVGISVGGFGAGGGGAGAVTVESYNNILTQGVQSNGIAAQSLGGGGGNGGFAVAAGAGAEVGGSVAVGGFALSGGGSASTVTVTSVGTIETRADMSNGILAQSIGGGGGNGGFSASGNFTAGSAGIGASVGGKGSEGGGADTVKVYSYGAGVKQAPGADWTIYTTGVESNGILAQSIGGGGGNGGFAVAGGIAAGGASINVSVGGFGDKGGPAGSVTVESYNNIHTGGTFANAISAQSIGGGGGNGGFAVSGSGGSEFATAVAVGGFGAGASDGKDVTVTSYGVLQTIGESANGILAQSIGGGGGNGGFAVTGTVSAENVAVGANVGGAGAGGGKAGAVSVYSYGAGYQTAPTAGTLTIETHGAFADGILAQSIGGGGGNGGFSVGGGFSPSGGPVNVSVGGFATGGGGNAELVTVESYNNIKTNGLEANAIAAQSIGGGGGNGGFAVTAAAGSEFAAGATIGGQSLSAGGNAGEVHVTSVGTLQTGGDSANGILAQSLGGGGGNGGFALAGAFTLGEAGVSASVGGKGANGGAANQVIVSSNVGRTLTGNAATIYTTGQSANGIEAQSIGGGGGNGGFSGGFTATAGAKASISLSVGGFGGDGNTGQHVGVTSVDNIATVGDGSNGILAQSIGGGGGNGGFSFAGTVAIPEGNSLSLSASLGGFGGAAGDAGTVTVDSTGLIQTLGNNANGTVAQSIGGGGGNGGLSVAGTFNFASENNVPSITASVGGTGGSGGAGKAVDVTRVGATTTLGDKSNGILAQSVGGGGGNGGLSIAGSLGGKDAKQISASLGGFGGAGSEAGDVTVNNTGPITTGSVSTVQALLAIPGDPQFAAVKVITGNDSNGILAQSIGGGGGNGGFAFSGAIGPTGENMSLQIGATVGGFGGGGGTAGNVKVTDTGDITTYGDRANGISAQSIGGGGGNGGSALTGLIAAGDPQAGGRAVSVAVSVGGFGGDGNLSGSVMVEQTGSITTWGSSSNGILAQSIGGGGGTGGNANSLALQLGSSCTQSLVTKIISSCQAPKKPSVNVQVDVGGFGGTGNDANLVTVLNHGAITTYGASSVGILAQSIGGGGGNGGQAIVGLAGTFPGAQYVDYGTTVVGLAFGTTGLAQGLGKVTVGGFGGASGDGKTVTVTNEGVIQTFGTSSHGIFAQSVGGGGGVGGNASSGVTGLASVGGFGGGSGDGGNVTVINKAGANITTTGDHADAILAQSVGGGGGEGNVSGDNGTIDPTKQSASAAVVNGQTVTYPADATNDGTVAGNGGSASGLLALGGFGGASGSGGTVEVDNSALLSTQGAYSAGIVAQSIGGGGGNGGGTGLSGIAVGGFASVLGATGNGGDVTVKNDAVAPDANTATIYTKGLYAYGILAQSVGGSGGSGGGNSLAAGVTVGGFGGNAGDGGHVKVFNYGAIGTEGTGAAGILAQSVGGSGGTGGGGLVSLVTVGGRGGSGGKGGEVNVTNTAAVQTKGAGASAIFAQSVGGGGGAGGGTSSSSALAGSLLVSVGGKGEGGGIGGTVTVDNAGALSTQGNKSYGVYAQSIGGGGGDGGMAVGTIAVGGSSSTASDGGSVTVTNQATGQIVTHGLMADAIFAQSVGGGGGNGGGAWSELSVGVSTSVGGTGGGGGNGGAVHVDNSAVLVTYGANTEAIFAQSVGAGGGNGAMAGALSLQSLPDNQGTGVSIGGSGFAAGNGGEVKVNNFASGSITTNGANSTGIFAQSVGGGGGNGGYALTTAASVSGSVGIAIGGNGGAAGNGGAVTVTNAGQIVLNGNNNLGIMAQSVGGGGGVGADALGLGDVSVLIGGQNGATGHGGNVKVVNSGTIVINGDNSAGLFAQSVGGGGGMVKPGGGAAAVTAATGGTGDGGTVIIDNSGAIVVTGANSAALFAQSVGGGGGVVGLQSDPLGQTGPFLFAGTSGGSGSAAAITINQSNALVADGENSIALVAQSSAPGGNGDITVNILTPDISAGLTLIEGGSKQGAGVFIRDGATNTLNNGGYLTNVLDVNGYAVRATGGDDTVNNTAVMIGSVDLGTGVNALNNQAGALFDSGTVVALGDGNLMTNSGLLAPGKFENVMTTTVTGKFAQTTGGVYGLDLQFATNTTDEIVVSGTGPASGTANVQGTVLVSIMSPGLAQSGTHENTIVHAEGGITGHDGLSLAYVPTAVATYSLVYPNPNDIDLKYVIDYSPTGLTINQHSVGTAINAIQAMPTTNAFTPIAAALFYQPTVKQLGAIYDSLSGEGVSGAQQPAFTAADRFVSVIGQQMNFWLSGEEGSGVVFTQKPSTPLAYAEPPRVPSPFGALPKAGPVEPAPFWRLWASGFGGNGSQKGDAEIGSAQLRYRGTGAAMGVEYHPSSNAMIGSAIGGSTSVFGVNDRATSGNFEAAHLGLFGAWRDEHLYLQGTAAFSTFDNRYERHAMIPGIQLGSLGGVKIPDVAGFDERLKGAFNSRIFGGRLETGWRIHAAPGLDVSPFAAVQLSRLETDGFTEQQTNGKASQIGLSYAHRIIPSLPIFLGTQIDNRVTFENGMELHSFVRAAWVHEFSPDRSVNPSFIAAPGYDFIIQGARAASDSARIDGGLQLKMSKDVSLFGNVGADISGVGHTFTAGGGMRISW